MWVWVAWRHRGHEGQLNLHFKVASLLLFFCLIYYPRKHFKTVSNRVGHQQMGHDVMGILTFPTIFTKQWTSKQCKCKLEKTWVDQRNCLSLFVMLNLVTSKKSPCVSWSRFSTVWPYVPNDQWISVKILSIPCFSCMKCYYFSPCLYIILTPPSSLTVCSSNIQTD